MYNQGIDGSLDNKRKEEKKKKKGSEKCHPLNLKSVFFV
jgi:hypothetical protein